MLKQLCLVCIAFHIIYIHQIIASDKPQSPDKKKEPTTLVERMARITLDSSLPIGQKSPQVTTPAASDVRHSLVGKLIHEISFDQTKYIKITKIVHVDTQEFFEECMHYDEKALKEGKQYVMRVDHHTNVESCERLTTFHAHLSLIKEMMIADRLKHERAAQDILFRQNYAPFTIP